MFFISSYLKEENEKVSMYQLMVIHSSQCTNFMPDFFWRSNWKIYTCGVVLPFLLELKPPFFSLLKLQVDNKFLFPFAFFHSLWHSRQERHCEPSSWPAGPMNKFVELFHHQHCQLPLWTWLHYPKTWPRITTHSSL